MEQSLEQERNRQARSTACAAVDSLAVSPTGIVQYTSRGRVLVVGDEEAQLFANRIEPPLHAEVLLQKGSEEPGVPVVAVGGRKVRINGHLGAFVIELGEPGKPSFQRIESDMVLDFGEKPLIGAEFLPPGYWYFSTEPQEMDRALLEIAPMVGTFEKPRFFDYDPDICAHARAGREGCERCILACPADAIISIGESVEVNPNLCQGGGVCASVCPTGAMRYAYPSPADTLRRVHLMLKKYLEAGGNDPVVLFASEADAMSLGELQPNILLLVVEELGSVGLEVWLSALAWGAQEVLLADGESVLRGIRLNLDEQMKIADSILHGMAYPANLIRFLGAEEIGKASGAKMPQISAAAFESFNEKRTMLFLAIDHLFQQSGSSLEMISLPDDAAFGRIEVESSACTLCMGCTSVCPVKALQAGNDEPRLQFIEQNCVQCGLCESACPENAITLQTRLLTSVEKRRQLVTLHEEAPFLCCSCGKPFASKGMISKMLDQLSGHPIFQSERAIKRLQMCEECRVVDAIQDQDAIDAGIAIKQPETNQRKN
ncbi:4Fe-4S binding protein [Solemya velum gill symbiont]|uniref:4Fe-4S binding protein n=1 Tax=Solemya velum gill symbiont TaxID=2340 RepID=UPI000998E562|nr:4Fe-4S binding protein [Solemya velum gill symbiont]OOY99291.1 hypothetical protein BOW19_05130 [Solemya velum gill symbiont]OOZ01464.1 hypothetical protein BOW20_05130 [Solemya velum gill symbiont]OOZ03783.1 hypothetical protein BOW21_05100 [Solemya velum gill symbiont]OOZ06012.1 hypothetical protein BOW22_05085 [Solemya velum gill symbiont]OOZ08232.1 hypothetical protein BOW23_05080 [Solemya velum gill symbiont]